MSKPLEITFAVDGQEYTMKRMNMYEDDILFEQHVITDQRTGRVLGPDMKEIWFQRFKRTIAKPPMLKERYLELDKSTGDSLKAVFMMLNETELSSALNALNPSQEADQKQTDSKGQSTGS